MASRCGEAAGQDETSMVKHVNRFIVQCGEAASQDVLGFDSSLCLCLDQPLLGLLHYQQILSYIGPI